MDTTHRYRKARLDPEYDNVNLSSDSETTVNDARTYSEVVVDTSTGDGVFDPFRDSPENTSSTNGIERLSSPVRSQQNNGTSDTYFLPGSGDAVERSKIEEDLDELFSDMTDDDLGPAGSGDVRMRGVAASDEENDAGDFSVEEAIEIIGFGRFQLKMSAIVCVLHMSDAGELMLLSMLSPELHCKWHLEKWQQALITTIVFCGYLLASPFWGKFADKYGRKTALIGVGYWIFIFGLLSAFSPNYPWMLLLRGIAGIGIGGAAQNVTLYSEFLPAKVRGFWLTLVSFAWIAGVLWVVAVAYVVMPNWGWRWLLICSALPLIIFIVCCYMLPESAYYHVACGNKEKAMDVLREVARVNKKPLPIGELKMSGTNTERGKFKDLYCDVKTGITTSLLLFIWFTMAFVYYGVVLLTTELFTKGHSCAAAASDASDTCFDSCESLSRQDYANLMITTFAEVPGTFFTLAIIDYLGRKKTMTIQYILCGGIIFLLMICIKSTITLTIILFCARGLISGAFQGIYVYTPEVYPTNVRGIGLGTCGSIARIGCIITPFVAQVLLEYSPKGTIGLYGGICFAAALAIWLLPIETKGRKMLSQVKEAKQTISSSLKH